MAKPEDVYTQKKKCFEKIKEIEKEISENEKLRNEHNDKVKEYKKKRDALTKDLKSLQKEFNKLKKIPKPDVSLYKDLQRKHKQLDWKYQTEKISMRKEKEIVKELDALEAKLLGYKEARKNYYNYDRIKKKVLILQKKTLRLHRKVIEAAKESEKYHNKLRASVQKLRELQKERRKYDAYAIKKKKATVAAKKEVREFQDSRLKKVRTKLVSKAKDIMSKFKKGGKITSEELQILQETELK